MPSYTIMPQEGSLKSTAMHYRKMRRDATLNLLLKYRQSWHHGGTAKTCQKVGMYVFVRVLSRWKIMVTEVHTLEILHDVATFLMHSLQIQGRKNLKVLRCDFCSWNLMDVMVSPLIWQGRGIIQIYGRGKGVQDCERFWCGLLLCVWVDYYIWYVTKFDDYCLITAMDNAMFQLSNVPMHLSSWELRYIATSTFDLFDGCGCVLNGIWTPCFLICPVF
jgi:hypothetical protein